MTKYAGYCRTVTGICAYVTLDDCDISSRRRWTPWHWFLGEHGLFVSVLHWSSTITFSKLANPDGKALAKQIKQSTGTVSITAEEDGRHEYCFSNMMSAISDKIVRCVPVIPSIIHFPDGISLVSTSMVSYTLGKMVLHTFFCQIHILTHA